MYYICRDYLGSITHITTEFGELKQELSYDAWGRLRNPNNQELYAVGDEPNLFLNRGYTGHEHLAMFGLINMNARLYDPVVGRFLSPDPYVQASDMSQNFNRYSYCLNNPLKYNDESGELFGIIGGLFKGTFNFFQGMNKWIFHKGNFNKDVIQASIKPIVNGAKIDAGMFAGKPLQILSRWTWELPQTVFGYATAATHNALGGVKNVSFYGGATVIESYSNNGAIPLFGNGAGVTMGSFIIGERGIKADPTNPLFQHEYGHYLQSQMIGLFYLPVIGAPSLINEMTGDKNDFFTEKWANNLAYKHFSDPSIKKGTYQWDFGKYPIDDPSKKIPFNSPIKNKKGLIGSIISSFKY